MLSNIGVPGLIIILVIALLFLDLKNCLKSGEQWGKP